MKYNNQKELILLKITITAKIKILPNEQQQQKLMDTMRAVRKALNYASEKAYQHNLFTENRLHKITYRELRNFFGLKSQMACSVNKTVCAKYKSMKSNNVSNTLARFKKPEYDLVWNRDYALKPDYFSVNTLEGRIKVPYITKGMEHFFDGSWSFGTAKLVQKKGNFFLHIPMSKEMKDFDLNQATGIVGIDLGVNFVATVFDHTGKTTFFSGKQIKQKRAKYQLLRKELQQRQTPSARRRLKAIGQRENRWMTDVNHVITKALVKKYGPKTLFVLEDLTGIRKATEKVSRKNRYATVSWAFGQFRDILTYKAKIAGSDVILVDPKYTSQDCPKCSHRDKRNRNKKKHIFCCTACSYRSNDDRVGAMNLYSKGTEYLSRVSV
jgi:IS605 OrfB family transposase